MNLLPTFSSFNEWNKSLSYCMFVCVFVFAMIKQNVHNGTEKKPKISFRKQPIDKLMLFLITDTQYVRL
jgi:hypothetical protein